MCTCNVFGNVCFLFTLPPLTWLGDDDWWWTFFGHIIFTLTQWPVVTEEDNSSAKRVNVRIDLSFSKISLDHYNDVIMSTMASQITSLTIVFSCADQRNHQSSASLAFVRGLHWWPVNSPHKWPETRKMFLFDDVIMRTICLSMMVADGICSMMVAVDWSSRSVLK